MFSFLVLHIILRKHLHVFGGSNANRKSDVMKICFRKDILRKKGILCCRLYFLSCFCGDAPVSSHNPAQRSEKDLGLWKLQCFPSGRLLPTLPSALTPTLSSHPYPQPSPLPSARGVFALCGGSSQLWTLHTALLQSEENKCYLAEAAVAGLWLSVEVDSQSEKASMVGTGWEAVREMMLLCRKTLTGHWWYVCVLFC